MRVHSVRRVCAVMCLLAVLGPLPAQAAPADGAAEAVVPVIDGRVSDWVGASPMIGGQSVVSQGEFIYQDYIYDDLGANLEHARLPNDSLRMATRAGGGGTYYYPNDPGRYASNAADIFQFRAKEVGDRVNLLVRLTTLVEPDSTVVGIALGDDDPTLHEWPLGAGISTPGMRHMLTVWGAGGSFDGQSLEAAGIDLAVSVEDNAFELSLPADLVGTQFRAYVAAGLWDPQAGRWMEVGSTRTESAPGGGDGAHPNIFNVAFRHNESTAQPGPNWLQSNWWWDRAQANALTRHDIDDYFADIDLTAADTPEQRITGFHQRIYRSDVTVAPHEGVSEVGGASEEMHPALIWYQHFVGPWQPYNIYIPEVYDRMTVLIHGSGISMFGSWMPGIRAQLGDENRSILVDPLARGVTNGYVDWSHLAVLEAMDDAQTHYTVDPTRTVIGGVSMGGLGTSRLLGLNPDLFAGGIIWSGCAGNAGYCTWDKAPIDLFGNYRNLETLIHHGGTDYLLPPYMATQNAAELERLGYPYELYMHPTAGHTTFMNWDHWHREAAFIRRQVADPNPPHVTYRTSEAWWSPEISPRLVFDHAYWVSDLRVRDTALAEKAYGTVDATTSGLGGSDLVTRPATPSASAGPPAAYTFSGRTADAQGTPIAKANRFTATLTNLRVAGFDLARMGLTTDSALTATVTTDGATDVRLRGAGPVSVSGASSEQDGDDVVIHLAAAGTHELTLTRSAPASHSAEPYAAADADTTHAGVVESEQPYTWDGRVAAATNLYYNGIPNDPRANKDLGPFKRGRCSTEPWAYCETVLLELRNPVTSDDVAAGITRKTRTATVTVGDFKPVPDPAANFDLVAYTSDPSGAKGQELARDGNAQQTALEKVEFPIETTRSRPSRYVLIEVVYATAPHSGYSGTASL